MQGEHTIWPGRLSNLRLPRYLLILLAALFTVGAVAVVAQVTQQRSAWDAARGDQHFYARYSPDNRIIATSTLDGINLWNVSDGRLLDSVGDSSLTPQLAFTQDGDFFVWSYAKHAFFYSLRNGRMAYEPIRAQTWIYALAISPNSTTVATGGEAGAVELWNISAVNTATGPYTVEKAGDKSTINVLAFSSDGKMLAAGVSDGSVSVWQVEAERLVLPVNYKVQHRLSTSTQLGAITQVAVSPDNQMLAVSSVNGKFALLSLRDSKPMGQLLEPVYTAHRLTFSQDSKLLAVAFTGGVSVWRVNDGARVWTFQEIPDVIADIKFSPDGKGLTVGYYNRSVQTYNLP